MWCGRARRESCSLRWSQSMAKEAPAYRKEFAALLHELEEELLEDVKNEGGFIDCQNQERGL